MRTHELALAAYGAPASAVVTFDAIRQASPFNTGRIQLVSYKLYSILE